MKNRAGQIRTNFKGEQAYCSFVPAPLPPHPPVERTAEIHMLLTRAHALLADLQALLQTPESRLFVPVLACREALLSSRIEEIHATLEDVLDPFAPTVQDGAVHHILALARATDFAVERMQALPLCHRLLREAHAYLMDAPSCRTKSPGAFRRSQNWIGGQGSILKDASYVPPAPEDMNKALSDLESYFHVDDGTDALVQAALIHYQFETIHPFLDGNGRIGRLLITLFLLDRQLLPAPVAGLSSFFLANRQEYYDRMHAVREAGDYEQWVAFFLRAVLHATRETMALLGALTSLHAQNVARLAVLGSAAQDALPLLCHLAAHPVLAVGKKAEALGLCGAGTASAAQELACAGILVPVCGDKDNRLYAYKACLDILQQGEES